MKNKKILFRSDVSRGIALGAESIDRKNGIIRGFSVITLGEAKGHGMMVDETTLSQVAELGNKSDIGIKSRFGHPNMSQTSLGKFIGRDKNFRVVGDKVLADKHIDKTAYNTPTGDLGSYVLDLSESDPDAFGTSIVFSGKLEKQLDQKGVQLRDQDGKDLLPLARAESLYSVDVVDDPAANSGFFSADVGLSAEVTVFLDSFLTQPDAQEKVAGFFNRYFANKSTLEKEIGTDLEDMMRQIKDERDKLEACGLLPHKTGGNTVENEPTELSTEHLELIEGARKEGFEKGVKTERARALSISAEAFSYPVDVKVEALSSIERGEHFDKALLAFKDKQLSALRSSAPAPTGPGIDPDAESEGLSSGDKNDRLWASSQELRDTYDNDKDSFLAFEKADAAGLVRMSSK